MAALPPEDFKLMSKHLDDAAEKLARVVMIMDKSEAWNLSAERREVKNMYLRICKMSEYFDDNPRKKVM